MHNIESKGVDMVNNNKKYNIKSKSRKELESIEKKYKSGYLYKLWAFRIALVLVVVIIGYNLINNVKWIDNINDSDISALNPSTYSDEIVELYNRDGEQEKFETYINELEQSIAIYLISNTTVDEGSFEDVTITAQNYVNSDDWSIFNLEKDEYYNGNYIVDENGNVKFTFAINSIEPNWASNSEYVVLN